MGKQSGVPAELTVLLSGRRAGMLRQDLRGRLSFEYDPDWTDEAGAYSLSLSMPMARRTHDDTVVRPFLEGLLPDDDERLKQLGRTHQVSAGNPFALLTHLGEDCAGAVQFVREDRLEEVLRRPAGAEVVWREEDEIGRDLRELVAVRAGERSVSRSYGYFSLAGAQPKLALLLKDGRWGVPHGRTPTTHILKPPAIKDVDGFAVNEHFCLQLARATGIDAAESEVRTFGGETAIVVTRYDRAWQGEWPMRVHQEDVCQALSVPPRTKYEHEGGPGALAILQLLEDQSDDPARDVARFLDALALNWVIGGTDAHAKNYSLLLRAENRVALAPFYDLGSMLAYPSLLAYRKVKLAMRIGREYSLWKIDARHWARMAEEAGLDRDPVIERVTWITGRIRDAVPRVAQQVRDEGLDHDVVRRLETELLGHAERCLAKLSARR